MELIYADAEGIELGELSIYYLDVDIGNTNEFQLTLPDGVLREGYKIFAYDTEYGGLLRRIKTDTSTSDIIFGGLTWRGMLMKKVIRPATGQDYRIVSGNAAAIINGFLTETGLSGSFVCDSSAITISSYQFKRYCTLLDGIRDMLKVQSKRINIEYRPDGKIHLSVVDIIDHSELIEFSQDGDIQIILQRNNDVVNHLICLGRGDLKDREVIDLYMDAAGNVSQKQIQFGAAEVVETYDYGSSEDLLSDGIKKLQGQVREKAELNIRDVEVSLHDIVGARDYYSGTYIKREITNKIIRVTSGTEVIEYKVGE